MFETMTVAELIECLKQYDPNALVMCDCSDDFYSQPLIPENIGADEAFKVDAFEQLVLRDDAYGNSIGKMYKFIGGWQVGNDDERAFSDRKSCVVIHIGT